jgi:hypothetical protein
MTKNGILKWGYRIVFTTLLVISCTNEDIEKDIAREGIKGENVANGNSINSQRAAYNNYFDLDNSFEVLMKDEKGGTIIKKLPWQKTEYNTGIPEEWCDPNIESTDLSKKKYTKANGWELVFCNNMVSTSYKYIGIYNRYTGVMRFFMYIFSESGTSGSSSPLWGVGINTPTSLFNFTTSFAKGNNEKSKSPVFATTSPGSVWGTTFTGIRLQYNVWYGFEFVCAYDPTIKETSNSYITLMGRAIDETITIGNIQTSGTINGTIKGTLPTSSASINFSNMFNTSSSTDKSITISNTAGIAKVGENIDKKISANDSFFKGLWDNIKSNASQWITSGLQSGAKKGLEAIMSQGTSVISEAIGGLFNTLTGKKGNTVDLNVELNLKMNSEANFTSTKISQGWSDVPLPVPGSIIPGGAAAAPLYNEPLGVWNLKNTPVVKIHAYEHQLLNYPPSDSRSRIVDRYYFVNYDLSIASNNIEINPAIKDEFDMSNLKYVLLEPESAINTYYDYRDKGVEYTVLDDTNYYRPSNFHSHNSKWINAAFTNSSACNTVVFKVQVSFDLVKKSDPSIVYTYSKVFDATNKIESVARKPVWSSTPGNLVDLSPYRQLPSWL